MVKQRPACKVPVVFSNDPLARMAHGDDRGDLHFGSSFNSARTGAPSSPLSFIGRQISSYQPGATSLKRSEEHTSELQSLMRISYAVFCLKKKKPKQYQMNTRPTTHI